MPLPFKVVAGCYLIVVARCAYLQRSHHLVEDLFALVPGCLHFIGCIAETPRARQVVKIATRQFGEDVEDDALSQA